MHNKRFILVIIAILIIIYSFNSVYAHPGRTDKNGGHYVRTTGWGYSVVSYHYHNGEYSPSYSTGSSFDLEVYDSQVKLNELGYKCGNADGILGIKTKNAIKGFQKDNKLVIDGTLNSKTKQLLNEKYNTKVNGASSSVAASVNPINNNAENASNNSNVDLQNGDTDLITLGMTRQDVLKIMGEPIEFSMRSSFWYYGSPSISFDYNNKVSGWSNKGELKVR